MTIVRQIISGLSRHVFPNRMMCKSACVWVALGLLSACGNLSCVDNNPPAGAAKQTGPAVEILDFRANDIGNLEYEGEFVHGLAWNDRNGHNIVVFSQSTHETREWEHPAVTRELHIYHYANPGAGFGLRQKIQDFENDCIFDNRAGFVLSSIRITDLNSDGYAEVLFVYRLGCTSELSPDGLTLILLENGQQYAIRGDTLVDYGFETVGGATHVDSAFNTAPKEFLAFARQIWEQNQAHPIAE